MKEKYSRTVVFDGDCGFCKRSVRFWSRFDWLETVDWRPRLEPGLVDKFPSLASEDALNRMVSIRPDGRTYGGFYAVRDIMIRLPLWFLPSLFLYVPGISILGVPAYRWVSRNRHRFGGKTKEACELK